MNEPVISMPLHVAAIIYRRLPHGLAALVAGRDPALDRALAQFRAAAHVDSELRQRGTTPTRIPEQRRRSYTTAQAADRLRITDRGVRQAIERGRLPATSIDGHWQITASALEAYAAQRR